MKIFLAEVVLLGHRRPLQLMISDLFLFRKSRKVQELNSDAPN